jgi:xanthine dehydrogenase D subunit
MSDVRTTGATDTRERTRGGVGDNAPRVDGVPKVTGAFAYGSDLHHDRMLWGATLRTPYAHARIERIDIAEALASPGVLAVLTHEDVPAKKTYGLEFSDQPVLPWSRVLYVGQPVAIVAAETLELAKRAAAKVHVEYEVFEPVLDMVEALDPGAPALHEWGNVLRHVRIEHGDPDAEADVWVEGYYETAMQDQAALGPEAGLAIPAEDGGVDLIVSTQWLHVDRNQIAPVLGLPEDKVRITLAGVGGAFGSREDLHMQIHACMLAMRTGRPVKMSYGRAESFLAHVHRHPSRIWLKTGATRDGKLVAVRGRIVVDGGAFASSSPAVVGNATTFLSGPYEVPNALLEGTGVYTNNPPCGAMRGFGAPQVCFAHEANMDKLAAALDMDPVELRLKNVVRTGSTLPTGQRITGTAPAGEVLERARDLPMPEAPETSVMREPMTFPGGAGNVGHGEGLKRGVGYALGYKNIAYSEGFDDFHQAKVTLSNGPDGPVAEVHTAGVECGQGLSTIVTQIARTELGIDRVILHAADTQVDSAGSSSASRQTFMGGGAVQMACRQAAGHVLRRARERFAGASELALEDGRVVVDGAAVADLAELLDEPVVAIETFHHRKTGPFDDRGQGDIHVFFGVGAMRAVVEVDEELGLVKVVHLASVLDVGKALNPQGVEGQSEGGSAQGLGLAVMEEIQLKHGAIANASFTDYLIPTTLDMPTVVTDLVEIPEPDVPFGAKGVGEMSTIVSTAAIVAALRDATGRALNRAPVRPDDLVGLREVPAPPWPPVPNVPGQEPLPQYFGVDLGQHTISPRK